MFSVNSFGRCSELGVPAPGLLTGGLGRRALYRTAREYLKSRSPQKTGSNALPQRQ